MIKFLIQKTLYKKESPQVKEILWKILSRQHIIKILCVLIVPFNLILTFIPIFIILLCEDVQLAISTNVLLCIFDVIYGLGILFAFKFFKDAMFVFSQMISWKIYYFLYTRRGKALTKYDFKTIKSEDENLFDFISSEKCSSCCYSTCFLMLKLLQKGHMEYIGICNLTHDYDEDKQEQKPFTMHVLYVNNGWAFDTNCQTIQNVFF